MHCWHKTFKNKSRHVKWNFFFFTYKCNILDCITIVFKFWVNSLKWVLQKKPKNVHIICHNHKISLDTHSCIMFCIRSWNSHGRKKGLCLCGGKGLAIKCPILTRICKFTELVSNPLELQIQLKKPCSNQI